jgi:hypothetical protein
VQRVTMLATPDGEWVFEGSPEFHAALGDPDPDYDATLFAVKNLGFIKLEMLDNSVLEIEFHPRNVGLSALLAIQQQLQSMKIGLFRLKHFDVAWRSEITFGAEQAMARIAELCAPVYPPHSTDKFLSEKKDYLDLYRSGSTSLRIMAQKWRMSFGHFDSGVLSFAIRHGVLGRMVIAGVRSPNQEPVFRFIGDGFQWLDNEFPVYGIGEKIENLPDKEYGSWIAAFYKSVAAANEPCYDIVTAAIQTNPRQFNPYLTRYERLLLPWKTPSGEILVTLLSEKLGDRKAGVSGAVEPAKVASLSEKSS